MAFANSDRRQPIQESAHNLETRLRCCVSGASNDHCPVSTTIRESGGTKPLSEPANQTHGSRRPERGPVVLIHLVAESRITDLVEPHELIQSLSTAVRHENAMERHG
jgi:hypothetical protein